MVRNFLNCWDYPTGLGTGCRVEIFPSDSNEERNEAGGQHAADAHDKTDTTELGHENPDLGPDQSQ